MNVVLLESITQQVQFLFRHEVEGYLVIVFSTYSLKFVNRVVPSYMLLNHNLIKHENLMDDCG